MSDPLEQLGASSDGGGSSLNMLIALSVALFSTYMAVANIKDGNITQAMQIDQSSIVDTWSQYQAKRMREAIEENAVMEAELLRGALPDSTHASVDKLITKHRANITQYRKDKDELKEKAKATQLDYEKLSNRDDQFDLSEALMSMSLALMAMCALTTKRFLLVGGWICGGLGLFMGVAGFANWDHVHPDWVIKFLT